MGDVVKVILPIAGLGKRLRPHTFFRPKPLISLAGKTILDFVLEEFSSINKTTQVEFAFIIGAGEMGEMIKDYMAKCYPNLKVQYFVQDEMSGQSDAIYCARDFLSGPTLIAFGDTITNPDLSTVIKKENDSNILWVKKVQDVSGLGVIKVNEAGYIDRVYEKPPTFISNLALIGFYYFKNGEDLLSAIVEQREKGLKLNNEYYLADAINILLERGAKFNYETVDLWLDAGKVDTLLETNAYLLGHGCDNSATFFGKFPNVVINPPVFIGENVFIQKSIIGPNVVIEAGCQLNQIVVRDAIIQQNTKITDMILEKSIIGRNHLVKGQVLSIV